MANNRSGWDYLKRYTHREIVPPNLVKAILLNIKRIFHPSRSTSREHYDRLRSKTFYKHFVRVSHLFKKRSEFSNGCTIPWIWFCNFHFYLNHCNFKAVLSNKNAIIEQFTWVNISLFVALIVYWFEPLLKYRVSGNVLNWRY